MRCRRLLSVMALIDDGEGGWNLKATNLPDFPQLDHSYLEKVTLGIYQINLPPSYIQDNMHHGGDSVFEYNANVPEPGVIHMQIFSRFRNATRYQLWISFRLPDDNDEQDDDEGPLLSYYCQCPAGSRTLGCCAHIASILWYFTLHLVSFIFWLLYLLPHNGSQTAFLSTFLL